MGWGDLKCPLVMEFLQADSHPGVSAVTRSLFSPCCGYKISAIGSKGKNSVKLGVDKCNETIIIEL